MDYTPIYWEILARADGQNYVDVACRYEEILPSNQLNIRVTYDQRYAKVALNYRTSSVHNKIFFKIKGLYTEDGDIIGHQVKRITDAI